MVRINGKAVSGGVAIGRILFWNKEKLSVSAESAEDAKTELERYRSVSEKTAGELAELTEKARSTAGDESAQIFEIHRMMLYDKDYIDEIERLITEEKYNAEYAVLQTSKKFSDMFSAMDSDYMKGRAADVIDISERLIRNMQNGGNLVNYAEESEKKSGDEKLIICADDLAPSETVQMDKTKVMAIATRHGSAQSHTAILARTMNIPAIIGLGNALSEDYDGMTAVVDGDEGCVYVEPTHDVLAMASERKHLAEERIERLRRLKGMEDVTIDGHRVMVYANIGTPEDLPAVLENDAGGIGLFRSEFLYLGAEDYPTEDEQFAAYKKVLQGMDGKKVIIRTLDIGADKKIDYFDLDEEENPAMGYRAIRICLSRRDIFKTQLRALLRASAYGKLSVMIPMVTSVDEVRKTRAILNEVKTELRAAEIPFDGAVEFGIMIETPAAVMISDLLAREVDFFSIGTNDLTQYSLAIDRQNRKLEPYYNPHHLAILRMIQKTAESAHKARIWCGICGELAGDLEMTETFLAMGIDELSVSPPLVLPLREKIRSVNTEEIQSNV